MESLTLTAKNTPVLLTPTGKTLIQNTLVPVQHLYISKHGDVNKPWITFAAGEKVIIELPTYFMFKDGGTPRDIAVMELF